MSVSCLRFRLTWLSLAATVIGLSPTARAYPFFAPRPVPNAIAGAADPSPAALFYNPAALGPLKGLNLHVEGGPRLHEGAITPAGNRANNGGSVPINWTDFDGLAGLTWDLRTDSFVIGLGAFTPLTDLTGYGGDSAVRYHALHHTFITFEQTAAAAFRVTSRLYIGAAANFAESWIDYNFARDAALAGGTALVDQPNSLCGGQPCGLENPLARQVVRLRGFGWGVGFSVGILARPVDRLWLGLSYISHVFNVGPGADFPLRDTFRARVRAAPGQGHPCPDLSAANPDTCPGNDVVTVNLPDLLQLAARIELNLRTELETQVRWVHYGGRTNLDVELQGPGLRPLAGSTATAAPPHFVLDRGLRDAAAFEVSARFLLRESLRLSPSLVFETTAVDPATVNAASIDANKIDVSLTAEWRPARHLSIGAHVGLTAYALSDGGQRFDPRAQVACVDARSSLDACQAVANGDALPSANATYTYVVPHFGAALGVEF